MLHEGELYHHSMLASAPDRAVRQHFLRLATSLLPSGAPILDFGAGTGLDAKAYAAAGHPTWVYEPAEAQHRYLAQHCRAEIESGIIIPTDFPPARPIKAIMANFAVLNLIDDHAALFASFARLLDKDGFVLANLLSPFYLGDARYGWWRANLPKLLRHGRYAVDSVSGVHRYTPRAVARAAAPYFRQERILPRGPALWTQRYMTLLFRRA